MSELPVRHLPGSQAAYEPWSPRRHIVFVDAGMLQQHLLPVWSTAFTESGLLWAAKLAESISAEGLQAVGTTINAQPRVSPASSYANTEERRGVERVIRLLDEWMADESGYDEETWPELKAALERDRTSSRNLFKD